MEASLEILKRNLPFVDAAVAEYLLSFLSIKEDTSQFREAFNELLESYETECPKDQIPNLFSKITDELGGIGVQLPNDQLQLLNKTEIKALSQPIKIEPIQLGRDPVIYPSEFWNKPPKIERVEISGDDPAAVAFEFFEGIGDGEGSEGEDEEGGCLMCHRIMPLTRHHVIPRTLHTDKNFKKMFTKEQMQTTILICRPCHSMIHSVIDVKTMGKDYNTLEKLLSHEKVQKWIPYISKQKVRLKAK